MRKSFDLTLMTASGFLISCSLGACFLGATHSRATPVRSVAAQMTDVNRANKGDQLTAITARQTQRHQAQQRVAPPAEAMKTTLQRPPLGCDGAFSPVADPARAAVYKRCTV